jgi:hypothetical protein
MPKMSQEAFDIRQAQLQWEFDRARETIMRDSYKAIDKAWNKYQQKLRVLTVV